MARKRLQYQAISKTLVVVPSAVTPSDLCFSAFSQPTQVKTSIAVESAGVANSPIQPPAVTPSGLVFPLFSQPFPYKIPIPLQIPGMSFCSTAPPPSPVTKVIFITAGTSFPIPGDWNSSNNTIEAIGPGGTGIVTTSGAAGAGGGAYGKATNVPYTPGNIITYQIGLGGSANQTFFLDNTNTANTVLAPPGVNAVNGTGALGGLAVNVIGGVGGNQGNPGAPYAYSGGSGGSAGVNGAAGGGGAAGPSANGVTAASTTNSETDGGAGDGGNGGAGGALGGFAGSPGGPGLEWQATDVWNGTIYTGATPQGGSGGGGGGGGGSGGGGAGGLYGGGAGSSFAGSPVAGGNGIIVLTYVPAVSPTPGTFGSFSKFSQPLFSGAVKAWEQPTPIFAVQPPQTPTPSSLAFADFDLGVRRTAIQWPFTNLPQDQVVATTPTALAFTNFSLPLPVRQNPLSFGSNPQVQVVVVVTTPFFGFSAFQPVLHAKPIVSYDFKGFVFPVPPSPIVEVVFDPFVKKKRKKTKRERDPYAEEAEIKEKRRAAIEDAVFGPIVEYTLPPLAFPPSLSAPPNLGDLPQIMLAAQQAQKEAAKRQAEADDEEDVINILREIL